MQPPYYNAPNLIFGLFIASTKVIPHDLLILHTYTKKMNLRQLNIGILGKV